MKPKRLLVLDFDGVLHSYSSGWQGANVIPDAPVPGAMAFLSEAVKHFRVAIFSSRTHLPGGLLAMQHWLGDHTDDGMTLAEIEWPLEKPPAFVTLDDRAITFTGEWPSMEELLAFKPWHARNGKPKHVFRMVRGHADDCGWHLGAPAPEGYVAFAGGRGDCDCGAIVLVE